MIAIGFMAQAENGGESTNIEKLDSK